MEDGDDEHDPAGWVGRFVNPGRSPSWTHPAFEDAVKAAHEAQTHYIHDAAHYQNVSLRQQRVQAQAREMEERMLQEMRRKDEVAQRQNREPEERLAQWKATMTQDEMAIDILRRQQYNQLQGEQDRQRQQQQLGPAPGTQRELDGDSVWTQYGHNRPVIAGELMRQSSRLPNRETHSQQSVRPADIGPSLYYPPNTSCRANAHCPASSQPSAGGRQLSRSVTNQQRTSNGSASWSMPRYDISQISSIPTSSPADQVQRSMASQRAQTGRPALVPNGLPLPDPAFGNYQRQGRDSAKTVDQLEAASKSPPEEFQGLPIEPSIRPITSSEKDVCTSAARSTLGPNSTNQTRSNVIEPVSVYWHPSQKPSPIPTAPVSSVLGSTVQAPLNYAHQGIQKDALVTSYMLHKPAPGSQKAAPVAHSKSRLSSMEGQEPPNKMRRIQDGSKQSSGPNTEEHMLSRKQTKLSIARRLGRLDLVEPLDVNEMDVKKKYDATTIARDVLIAAAKHPTENGLNHHLLILKDSIPPLDYSADLATLRWDLLDPFLSSRDQSTPTRLPIQPINATGATVVSSQLNPLSSGPSSLPPNALPLTSYPLKSGPPPPLPLSQPSRPIPAAEPAPSNSELPAKNPNIGSRSPSRSKIAAQESVVLAKSPRTKQSLQPAVVIHSSPQKMQTTKKRGRPRKDDVDKTTIDRILTPTEAVEYPVYKCHWEKCQAELHTLVLLQRHVLKAHVPHNLTCGWHGCENTTHMAASTLWEHMRDTHVKDYAWNLGDGPVVPSPGEDDVDKTPKLPHFNLFDRHARPGTLILPADRDLVEIFNRSRGISNSKQKAEAFIDGACRWKEEVGPDVDISDRRLSTPPRQISSQLTEIAYTLPGTA